MTGLRPDTEVAQLLAALRQGESSALEELLPHVYEELRALARAQVRGRGGTLQATALVHEAYMKLARAGAVVAGDRSHFLAIAARAMRQVVVDRARAALSQKRGGGWQAVTLQPDSVSLELRPEDAIALDRALEGLEPRQRLIVECRYFAGLDDAEIATVLGVTDRTVRREWVKARAWLYAELYGSADADEVQA
ncbi:MAG TPA: ECF-type sigma factor [Longimicrobiales bacterium]|nr:ECF-type sigma factor [Longimicrobiales bacterium]